jgi:transcriptional regulator with XRE-family HTH domain
LKTASAIVRSDLGLALGKAISAKRKSMGLSQKELAVLVDVDGESISRFERGTVVPSLHRLERVAKSLNMGVGDLLSISSPLPEDQTQQLLQSMQKLSTRDRKILMDLCESMSKR